MNHILEKLNGPQMWRDHLEERQRRVKAIRLFFGIVAIGIVALFSLLTLITAGIR